ncbi:MAG: hypothetical protein ACXAEI_06820 [Candidatus Hodarchaeales archaeon]
MSRPRTVLLLNATNLLGILTYPYAFVQVSEIADRFHIRTIRRDLIAIPEDHWDAYLRDLLKKTTIDMVLITIRNYDTHTSEDYQLRALNTNYHQQVRISQSTRRDYFPIKATKRLIDILRKISTVPICIGGYAFSIIPEKLMKYLQPDYGVFGGPDAFFEHFEEILANQNLDQVANLFHQKGNNIHRGPLRFFPPAPRREYTDAIIADRQAFYSHDMLGQKQNLTRVLSVPIEVARGCSMKCTYCSEPLIKGPKVQYRDLDVIEEEIAFLKTHDLNLLYMVCSEINTEGNDYFLSLADRILRINEQRSPYEKIYWYTFYLMRESLSARELKHFRKSGFLGGANDVVSFDDKNLAAVKAPCRKSQEVINHIIGARQVIEEELQQNSAKYPSLEERILKNQRLSSFRPLDDSFLTTWNLFLGNTAATPETIRITLKAADDAGLSGFFETCYVNNATRVFDYLQPDDELRSYIWSVSDKGTEKSYNEFYPSFTYSPALLRHFDGHHETLEDFFILVEDTYLSNYHLFKKDWNWFLASKIDQSTFYSWWHRALQSELDLKGLTKIPAVLELLNHLQKHPTVENLSLLFNPTPGRKPLMNFTGHMAIRYVLFSQETELTPLMEFLGMPSNLEALFALSPYKVAVRFFKSYADKEKLLRALKTRPFDNALSRFAVEYLVYLNDTPFRSDYRVFFTER